MTKQEILTKCAEGMANKCKQEMESKGKQWDLGDMQTVNTLPRYWYNLYKKYPINSKTYPAFSLNVIFTKLTKEGFII
ncbi:MAG: hypothetical protein K0Q53_121 [Massilibacillus sp.]|jgi:hypothetical protein|nr:hypothetical protein [Massilibacillus sp.]